MSQAGAVAPLVHIAHGNTVRSYRLHAAAFRYSMCNAQHRARRLMMGVFTPAELTYLSEQRLGRLATLDAAGAPHVVPVSFRYNAELGTIDIGGHKHGPQQKVSRRCTRRASRLCCGRCSAAVTSTRDRSAWTGGGFVQRRSRCPTDVWFGTDSHHATARCCLGHRHRRVSSQQPRG